MPSPLFVLDGLISARRSLVLDDVFHRVVVCPHGRLLVSMIDVLAIVRLDRDADVLLVEFDDGSSRAFRIADVLESDDVFIQLRIESRVDRGVWHCRLWTQDVGASPVVASIRVMTFAGFVGSR